MVCLVCINRTGIRHIQNRDLVSGIIVFAGIDLQLIRTMHRHGLTIRLSPDSVLIDISCRSDCI